MSLPPRTEAYGGGVSSISVPDPARWTGFGTPQFPSRLAAIEDRPAGLWLRSAVPPETLVTQVWSRPAVALVGSRAASSAGLALARELAWELARGGVVVVSGLARGVDAAAHEGALLADGATVAVLGCGIDDCNPPEHASMAERIMRRGVLVSEWPARTPARAWRFPRRNRLISGLCDVLVLVEGEARSGALHTVRFAMQQGREVMAVPRDPLLPGSVAPNRLIRDGAAPVLGAEDVMAALEASGIAPDAARDSGHEAAPEPQRRSRSDPIRAGDGAGALRRQLEGRLARAGTLTPEQLADGLPAVEVAELMAEVLTLEIEGRVARDGAGRLRLRAGA